MADFYERHLASQRASRLAILDVGSADVNGSYRAIFASPSWFYTGLDMAPGKNVDVVPRDPYYWREIAAGKYDVVISGQAFEHAEFFWETMRELARALKPGGLCCILAPSAAPEHRHPVDCWRFYPDGFVAVARYAGLEILEVSTDWEAEDRWFADTLLIARKPQEGSVTKWRRALWRWLDHWVQPPRPRRVAGGASLPEPRPISQPERWFAARSSGLREVATSPNLHATRGTNRQF
ncbi:MAG: methyltransferase domain-containing protein [Chthoniobacterales bacterium]